MGFLINADLIFTERKKLSKSKALVKIARALAGSGIVDLSWKQIFRDLVVREKDGNTYIDNGVSLPHIVCAKDVLREGIGGFAIIRLQHPLDWHHDSPPVTMLWGLLSSSTYHLRILKDLSVLLSNSDLIESLRRSSPNDFVSLMFKHFPLLSGKSEEPKKTFSRREFLRRFPFKEDLALPPGFVIHARPAALISDLAKSLPGEIFLVTKTSMAKADSITALLGLGMSIGKALTLAMRFPSSNSSRKEHEKLSRYSFRQIEAAIIGLSLAELQEKVVDPVTESERVLPAPKSYYQKLLKEVYHRKMVYKAERLPTCYPTDKENFIAGPLYSYQRDPFSLTPSSPKQVQHSPTRLLEVPEQILLFKKAVNIVVEEIENTLNRSRTSRKKNNPLNAIISSYIQILQDPQLHNEVKSHLSPQGSKKKNHPIDAIIAAWERVIRNKIHLVSKEASPAYLSRVSDWHDLGYKVRFALWELLYQNQGTPESGSVPEKSMTELTKKVDAFFEEKGEPVIFFCEEILPSEVLSLIEPIEKGRVAGIILGRGSRNSHAALMISNLALPVFFFSQIKDYQEFISRVDIYQVLLDLYGSRILAWGKENIRPIVSRLCKENAVSRIPVLSTKQRSFPDRPELEFYLNLNSFSELDLYQARKYSYPYNRIKGVGLMRTELFFSAMKRKPSLEQQVNIYQKVAQSLHPLPLVIRTLDLAQDKPITFLQAETDDPVSFFEQAKKITRFSEKERKFLKEQITAIVWASKECSNIKILFPMITSLEDFFYYYRLLQEGMDTMSSALLEIGVMIEAPSLIYQMKTLNRFTDFYSLGGNDLEKFLILESRDQFSSSYSFQHFPLLLAVEKALENAAGKPVTFCGNQVADPDILTDVIAAGIRRFSIPTGSIDHLSRIPFSLERAHTRARIRKYLF